MQSPFQKYFNTNHVPTDAEIERVRAHLVPHEAELARLESLIRELSIQRDRVKDYIGPHKALISHPRRLPQEIVEEIFVDCLPTDHNAIMSAAEAPLLLGRICSAWRSIAFGMPRLWNTLHIPLPFVADSESKKAALSHWLERSASFPLALTVIGAQYPGNIDTFQSLLRFSLRFSALHISKIQTEDFSTLGREHAPLLTEIHITFAHPLNADSGPGILASNIFRTVKPARITISGEGLDWLVPTVSFAWDHLSHLTLKGSDPASQLFQHLSSQTAHRLLSRCKNLISLHFPFSPRWQGLPSSESLVLPSLESLIIEHPSYPFGSAPSEDLVNLLSHLFMPHLRQFHLPSTCISLSGSTHEIFEHLAKHSPNISDFCFGLWTFTRDSLLETLHLFPVLAKLNLFHWGHPVPDGSTPRTADEILAALSPPWDAPNPLPSLTELDIMASAWLEDEVWRDFVEKQVTYETNLRRFRLTVWINRPPADVKLSLARGLEVSITYPTSNLRPTPWEGI